MPNKYISPDDQPSSPRCFPKDPKLEAKVTSEEYGFGLLMLIVGERRRLVQLNVDLDTIVKRGTSVFVDRPRNP